MEELDLAVGVTLEDITWENISGDIQDNQAIKGALETKANTNEVANLTGDQTIEGVKSFSGNMYVGNVENPANLGVAGDLTINGDFIKNGSSYETHAEKIFTKNDYIILRDGAVSGLLNGDYIGLKFNKYDGTNTGVLVVDNTGTTRVGDLGDEQPLLTRSEENALTNNGLLFWDSVNRKAINLSTVTVDNEGNLTATSFSGSVENALKDSEGNVIVDTYANRLIGDVSNNPIVYNKLLADYYSSFDITKFTINGNPTITNGIATGFSGSDYLTFPAIQLGSYSNWKIEQEFTTGNNITNAQGLVNITRGYYYNGCYSTIDSGKLYINIGSGSGNNLNNIVNFSQTIETNKKYNLIIEFTGTAYVGTLNGTEIFNVTSSAVCGTNLNNFVIGQLANTYSFKGAFNLEKFAIYGNGNVVFTSIQRGEDSYTIDNNTVTVPYISTSIGDKIVEMNYLTTVEEVTNYLGYNNYALIDETNSQFIMPQGYIQNKVYNIQQNVMGMIEVFNNLKNSSTEIYMVAGE